MTAEVRRQLSPAAGSCSSCGRVAGSAAGTNKKPSEAGLDQWEASRSPVAANQKRRRLQELAGDTMGVATPHSRHYLEPLDPAERKTSGLRSRAEYLLCPPRDTATPSFPTIFRGSR